MAGAVLSAVRAAGAIMFTHGVSCIVAQLFSLNGEDVANAVGGLLLMAFAQWGIDASAHFTGNRVVSQLRERALTSFRSTDNEHSAGAATLLTTGIDAVAQYVVSFLPSVVAAVVFTPIVAVALYLIDPLSGIAVAVTIPLIPLFMVLIGRATQATQAAQWKALSSLSVGFSEVVSGLTTLILFGREHRQGPRIRAVTEGYRESTMRVLRLSFLSSFALEIGASLAVAVVAVSIGIRLVNGDLYLGTGLWVLVLVPEAFTAIRLVGARFHASADGITVANDVFAIIETPRDKPVSGTGSRLLSWQSVTVDGRIDSATGVAHAGEVTVLSGPSGSGKSTLIDVLRGELDAADAVELDGVPMSLANAAWSPQDSPLLGQTVADAIRLGATTPIDQRAFDEALEIAAIDFDSQAAVSTLSGGQGQRVSVARAAYRAMVSGAAVVLLDEPTSALDKRTESRVVAGIRALAKRGHIVVVATHRPAVIDSADRVIEVGQ